MDLNYQVATNENISADSVVEINTNLEKISLAIGSFVGGMTNCFTVGNVNNKKFLKLRNDVMTDSLIFLNMIVPIFKVALISMGTFFDFINLLELEEYLECKDEIKKLADDAQEDIGLMLKVSQTTQSVFKTRSIEASNLLTSLKVETKAIEKEINDIRESRKETLKFSGVYIIPVVGLIAAIRNACLHKSLIIAETAQEEKLKTICESIYSIQSNLVAAINDFMEAIRFLTNNFTNLEVNSGKFVNLCKQFNSSIKSQKVYEIFFVKLINNSKQISNNITSTIKMLNQMEAEMQGLSNIKMSDENYITIWKKIYHPELVGDDEKDPDSLESILAKTSYWKSLKNYMKGNKDQNKYSLPNNNFKQVTQFYQPNKR